MTLEPEIVLGLGTAAVSVTAVVVTQLATTRVRNQATTHAVAAVREQVTASENHTVALMVEIKREFEARMVGFDEVARQVNAVHIQLVGLNGNNGLLGEFRVLKDQLGVMDDRLRAVERRQ